MFIYRAVNEDDLDDVYRLICELEDEELDRDKFQEVFLDNVHNENIIYLCAEHEKRVIAFGSLHIQGLLHHSGKVGEVQELIVDSSFQGMGIGREMVKRLMDTAAEKGCCQVEVSSGKSRQRAHEFYINLGFQKSHYKFTLSLDSLLLK